MTAEKRPWSREWGCYSKIQLIEAWFLGRSDIGVRYQDNRTVQSLH